MDGHSLCKRYRTVATSNERTNDIKTVRWRHLMDEHSLYKRHRTVAVSNVNATHRHKAGMLFGITFRRELRRILHFRETETVIYRGDDSQEGDIERTASSFR